MVQQVLLHMIIIRMQYMWISNGQLHGEQPLQQEVRLSCTIMGENYRNDRSEPYNIDR